MGIDTVFQPYSKCVVRIRKGNSNLSENGRVFMGPNDQSKKFELEDDMNDANVNNLWWGTQALSFWAPTNIDD